MSTSILTDVKKSVGIAQDDTSFDADIVMHTNGVIAMLSQLGIGPEFGFMIEDDTATWTHLLGDDPRFNLVKTYVYLRVRMLFDPPGTSFLLESFKEQITELSWRISAQREAASWVVPTYVLDGGSSTGE